MRPLFILTLVVVLLVLGLATLAQASPELAATPSIHGLTPFTPETNNMSLAGYARWQYHVETGTWLYYFTPETLYMSLPGYVRWQNFWRTGHWINIRTGQPM